MTADRAKLPFMRAALLAVLCAAFVAAPAGASDRFTAKNLLRVYALERAGAFEVVAARGAGPSEIWCAAAEYAQARLGPDFSRRIFISRPLSRSVHEPARKGVGFTVAPTPKVRAGPRPGEAGVFTVSVSRLGFNLSTSHAHNLCRGLRDKPDCPLCD
ncbi:MAG: hypothetical protein RI566_00620 [Sediminimonas sp.]|uniref:hypothetical protein n=1 Tax=Sediminimonas sp. TaxID=2823379 RepID=UPI0028706EC7|nr:hypothetical protein [Sediminimonas sp.]MDR9483650.1 hypothetical protein [Sediminimonas sp.]